MINSVRKILFFFLCFTVITGNAQTTYNVRIGSGAVPFLIDDAYGDFETDKGVVFAFQANIPVNTYKTLTVSPTLSQASCGNTGSYLSLPVYLGYKIGMGNKLLWFPKIGPMIAYEVDDDDTFYGYSAELALEYKHFVIAANYFYVGTSGYYLALGYKF